MFSDLKISFVKLIPPGCAPPTPNLTKSLDIWILQLQPPSLFFLFLSYEMKIVWFLQTIKLT